jgi:hypothetical protein
MKVTTLAISIEELEPKTTRILREVKPRNYIYKLIWDPHCDTIGIDRNLEVDHVSMSCTMYDPVPSYWELV